MIQRVLDFARTPAAAGRVVFLEDYEMTLARRLVQGVDVWLNTPRRPYEASGTSGMKAALNGVLNCSILDGWWAEAASPAYGFAIGGRRARRARRRGAGRGGRRRALRRARGGRDPRLLRAGRRRAAAALDRAHARVDRRARPALRHRADGVGVRRAALSPGARRRAQGLSRHRRTQSSRCRRTSSPAATPSCITKKRARMLATYRWSLRPAR